MIDLEHYFENIPFHKDVRFSKVQLPQLPPYFTSAILGELRLGMLGQYRCRQLHAYEFADYWLIHKDKWNPESNPIMHLLDDAPHWALVGVGLLGLGLAAYDNLTKKDPTAGRH